MSRYINELAKQKNIIEAMGHRVAYICLYGSQNYGLDINNEEYQSDIDMKAIIVPTLDDLINNTKPISKVIETEWGQCDLKDIRIYFDKGILKGNPVYLETLYTDFYIIDELFKKEFEHIRSRRDDLVFAQRYQMIRAMYGMMCEKRKALCHPYPSIKHKIDKFGYDGKQGHHIYRMLLMMGNYFNLNMCMKDCFTIFSGDQLKKLQNLKKNDISFAHALPMIEAWMELGLEIKELILEGVVEDSIDKTIVNELKKLSKDIIKNKIENEIKKEG